MTALPKLSPTSYALLGLLARERASAYDLNTVMQTSLIRVFWPRAESHVYSEPKKLLAHGLVSEAKEKTGGRSRTVYAITAAGRTALANWLLQEDSAEHRSQAEFMLKLILADGGSAADAHTTAQRALDTCRSEIEVAIAGIEALLDNAGTARPGMPWNGIAINLMADILAARFRWSQYATEATAQVADDQTDSERRGQGVQAYRRALDTLRALQETPSH
ncbi:MAG: PadR family transcriptional regulator [Halioglobus sp.]